MPLGAQSKARLADCHPKLRRVVEAAMARLDRARIHGDFTVVCGHRGQAEQERAVAEGKSRQYWPNSRHNTLPATAVDLAPYPTDWSDTEAFARLAGYVLAVADDLDIELEWGGDWVSFPDRPHFQLTTRELSR